MPKILVRKASALAMSSLFGSNERFTMEVPKCSLKCDVQTSQHSPYEAQGAQAYRFAAEGQVGRCNHKRATRPRTANR